MPGELKIKAWKAKTLIFKHLKSVFYGMFPYYNVRPMIQYIKEQNTSHKELVGVELGVARGFNALSIIKTLPIKKLYLVDPFEEYIQGDEEYTHVLISKLKNERCFNCAMDILKKHKMKIELLLKTSEESVSIIPNNLDFVYVDASHAYNFVKKDIELYYPKLVKGGVIGGDDFWAFYPGVPRAVFEFIDKNNLKLHGDNREWWIVKQ